MGWYERLILPRLIDCAMGQARLTGLREAQVGLAAGRVLEVGIGSGLNLPFYQRDLIEVVGVDPSLGLLSRARQHVAWCHFPVRLMQGRGEALPVEDQGFDTAVMTWTLCSVQDPLATLHEIRRALRPAGRLIFIEHGAAANDRVRRWQTRLTPYWRRLAGNCHLDRPVDQLLAAAGFRPVTLERGHLIAGPRPLTYHYRGTALAG